MGERNLRWLGRHELESRRDFDSSPRLPGTGYLGLDAQKIHQPWKGLCRTPRFLSRSLASIRGYHRLTGRGWTFRFSRITGEPTGAGFGRARRLRVPRGSVADPLNLLQVMLAKG